MRPHHMSPSLIPSIPVHLHRLIIQISINHTPRHLALRIIPTRQLLNHNRIRLHIKDHNNRRRRRRARKPVVVARTRRAARPVDLGDRVVEVGGKDFEDVELAAPPWDAGPAAVAAVLCGVEDLGVESPESGRFGLVGGGFGGHVEGEDEGFGA